MSKCDSLFKNRVKIIAVFPVTPLYIFKRALLMHRLVGVEGFACILMTERNISSDPARVELKCNLIC